VQTCALPIIRFDLRRRRSGGRRRAGIRLPGFANRGRLGSRIGRGFGLGLRLRISVRRGRRRDLARLITIKDRSDGKADRVRSKNADDHGQRYRDKERPRRRVISKVHPLPPPMDAPTLAHAPPAGQAPEKPLKTEGPVFRACTRMAEPSLSKRLRSGILPSRFFFDGSTLSEPSLSARQTCRPFVGRFLMATATSRAR